MESEADMILFDNGRGHSKSFNWAQVAGFNRPFILAGVCQLIMLQQQLGM